MEKNQREIQRKVDRLDFHRPCKKRANEDPTPSRSKKEKKITACLP